MEDILPPNWVSINLKDSVDFRKGKKPTVLKETYFEGSVPYMDIKGLEKDIVNFYADSSSAKYFKEDDVVIVWDGSRSGLILKPKAGAIGSTLGALSPNGYSSQFLYYFLLSHYETINSKARGVGIPHVDPTYLWNLSLPLPPLAEQKRIVAKLDALFAQHEAMKKALERIPKLLKDFRQQVLTQAVTGKLTEKWIKGKGLDGWRITELQSIAKIVDPQPSHRTPPQVEGGVPYISIGDINSDKSINFFSARKVSDKVLSEHISRYTLKEGDFIFGKIGTIGKPVKIPSQQNYCLSANVILIQPDVKLVVSEYVYLYMDSPYLLNKVMKKSVATSQPAYGIKKMRLEVIELPSIKEQQEIVSRVESLFVKADEIEERYKALKAKIQALPQAILHKTFKGELVEQLPTDGDAMELLKEIIALKEKVKKK